MRKFTSLSCILLISLFLTSKSDAQLVINGGSLTIGTNAYITVEGDVTNTGGTLTNNGKLEVKGSFTNTGTYNTTTSDDSLMLTGTGNVTLNTGSASLNYLQVNKTSGGVVTLGASTTITNKLDFLAGGFSTNPATAFELIAPAAAVFTYAAGTEVTGKVRRNGWVNGSSKNFNGTNMIVTTSGGTAPTSMLVNMIPSGDPTGTEREVKRIFNFTPTGGSGYTSDVTFPYKETTELNASGNVNTETNLVPWYYTASEWNAKLAGNTVTAASDYVTSTGIDATTFSTSEWKLADPVYSLNVTALLRGAWNGTTMNTQLNADGVLPLTQPYNTTPFNYTGTETVAAIPNANIVDWVLLELRKPSSGAAIDATSATTIGRKAVFLRNDGVLVDLNGTAIPAVTLSKQGASFIAVRHRNHLGVLSNSLPSNIAGSFTNDFTNSLANSYKDPNAASDPLVLLAGNTKFGLWAGDANKGGTINATDVSAIKSAIASSSSGYLLTDVNLSNSINATDVSLTKSTIALSGSGSLQSRMANGSVKSSLPN